MRLRCAETRAKRTPARKDAATHEQAGGRARTVCSSRNRDTCASIASASVSPAPSGCCRGRLQVTKLRLDLRSARDAVCSDVHRAGQTRGHRRKTLSILGAHAPAALVEAPATHGCKHSEGTRPSCGQRALKQRSIRLPVARVGATQGQRSLRGTGVRARSRCAHRPRLRAGRACPAHHRAKRSSNQTAAGSNALSAARTPARRFHRGP